MLIVAQILMMLTLVLFSMGAIADKELENRKIWSLVVVINLASLAATFVF